MIRPLRVGDRVTATGTVTAFAPPGVMVDFEGSMSPTYVTSREVRHLTPIAPAEPPVGSVVVKDGVAYHRAAYAAGWHSHGNGDWRTWDGISDGDVIFTPGGGSDVG